MGLTIITGANRGIGLELAKQLHERGDDVVALCRTSSGDLDSLGVRVESGVDVGEAASVAAVARKLGDAPVDLLINNAGILSRETLGDLDEDRIRRQFEVNSLGPVRVTAAFAPRLHEGSKVAIITSRMGSIEDNGSGGAYGYRMSKAAVNAAGKSLAMDLKPQGIAVVLLHPGFVRTSMTGNNGNVGPDEAARGLVARIDDLTVESTGSFFHMNGEQLPW